VAPGARILALIPHLVNNVIPVRLCYTISGPSVLETGMNGKPGKTVPTGFGDRAARPVIDDSLCTNCGTCIEVCSSETIVEVAGKATVVADNGMGCFACGHCMAVCPEEAVTVSGRRMTPDDAMAMPEPEEIATPEALHNLMLVRRAIRKYTKEGVSQDDLDRILEMTGAAPMGIAPSDVEVTVVNGFDRVQELAGDIDGVFCKWLKFFNPLTLAFMGLTRSKQEITSFKDFLIPILKEMTHARTQGTDSLFYNAPCVLLFHVNPMADPVDGTIACTYAMLAAQSIGLGTCMIGTAPHALDRDRALKAKWNIPTGNKVAMAMIVGHPVHHYHRVISRTLSAVRFK